MRIDPHTHSSFSDGTDTPTELLSKARDAGLDVIGLTDHDTVAGWEEAERAVATSGVSLLRGMEISCAWQGISMHLLSYLHDPAYLPLSDACLRARETRVTRAQEMVALLAVDFPITYEEVVQQAGGAVTIGRPHIADALVAKGCFPDRSAAFAGPLHNGSPYYVRHWALDPVDAVALVRAAGGVPVVAHPRASKRQKKLIPDEVFGQMKDVGLAGVEVDHRDHGPEQREQAAEIAQRYDLMMSGASDYHGAGKPNLLGENLMPEAMLETILEEGALPLVTP
ncbi:PHP domain-containing protein [Actinomyces vulturis]|uniref:PHP domain-containing protein n=1 Tax=Actinomyces vulturis TaxID=1857645 RepID=UPI000834EABB|nr:PHP domain-containing protein [Actinomyces vulturis]